MKSSSLPLVTFRANHEKGAACAAPFAYLLSILRLLGALGEREPPFGHFDEKRLMRRSASFLCQSNALSSIHAQLI
jgi:hypothetical protein